MHATGTKYYAFLEARKKTLLSKFSGFNDALTTERPLQALVHIFKAEYVQTNAALLDSKLLEQVGPCFQKWISEIFK